MFIDYLLSYPAVYYLWRNTHNRKLKEVIRREATFNKGDKVLDAACGVGADNRLFEGASYLGIDKNNRYISYAKAKYPDKDFVAADICTAAVKDRFNWILADSFFHNIPDPQAIDILKRFKTYLDDKGTVLIIDLLLPEKNNYLGRFMVSLDRGKSVRTLSGYEELFSSFFSITKKFTLKVWCWDFCVFVLTKRELA